VTEGALAGFDLAGASGKVHGDRRMRFVAIGRGGDLPPSLLSSMNELRNDVFLRGCGWTLQPDLRINAVEQDAYDTVDAVYLMVHDETARVSACARLLASTGPHMLREQFPQLLGGALPPNDPAIWELSRFAIAAHAGNQGRHLALCTFTQELLHVAFEAAQQRAIRRLIIVTSVRIERLLLRARFDAHRIAPPDSVEGVLCVAILIEVPPATGRS
jgi:acyl homoserine lactone synthase